MDELPQEKSKAVVSVEKEWPQKDMVEFKDVCIKYRPNTDTVLNQVSLKIESGQKVKVVGRTGAGKSTLCITLSIIVEACRGSIVLDGVDISKVDLQILRQIITIIQ